MASFDVETELKPIIIIIKLLLAIVHLQASHEAGSPHLAILVVHLVLLDHVATGRRAVVDDNVEVRPRLKLSLPVPEGGERNDDEERTADPVTEHLLDERQALDRLAETHLIGQNAVLSVTQPNNHHSSHTPDDESSRNK